MFCFPRTDGVVRFDGEAFQHFLPGYELDLRGFTPDGAAWFTGREPEWALAEDEQGDYGPGHTYVIFPDAAG